MTQRLIEPGKGQARLAVLRVGRNQRGQLAPRRRIIFHRELQAGRLHLVTRIRRILIEQAFVNGKSLIRLVGPNVGARQAVQCGGVVRICF